MMREMICLECAIGGVGVRAGETEVASEDAMAGGMLRTRSPNAEMVHVRNAREEGSY